MSSIKDKLKQVENIIQRCDFEELENAFRDMNSIIDDENASDDEIADAFLYIVLIVGAVAPYLTEFEEDETGLIYYIQGFKRNPLKIGILLNIINSFSDHDMRQEYTKNNKGYFIKAYDILKQQLYDTLSKEHKNDLHRLSSRYEDFIKEGIT